MKTYLIFATLLTISVNAFSQDINNTDVDSKTEIPTIQNEPTLLQNAPETRPSGWRDYFEGFYGSIGLAYSNADLGSAPATKIVTDSGSAVLSSSIEMEKSFTIGAEIGVRKPGLSWALGHEYDMDREAGALNFNSSTITASGATISLMNTYANVVYYLDNLYIKVGPNISSAGISVDGTSSVPTSTKPDWGLQAGVGYFISRNVAIDMSYRQINFNATLDLGNDVKIEFKKIKVEGLQIGVRYVF